jgi:hypothetical protein
MFLGCRKVNLPKLYWLSFEDDGPEVRGVGVDRDWWLFATGREWESMTLDVTSGDVRL